MTESTELLTQKALSIFDSLQTGVAQVGGAVVKYTPDVVEAGLTVVRIDAVQSIVTGLVCLGLFVSCVLKIRECNKIECYWDSCNVPFVGISSVICLVVSGCIAAVCLLNVWVWAGLFEPKLYIAHKIIEGVMK